MIRGVISPWEGCLLIEQSTLKNIRNKNMADILQVLREKGASSLSRLEESIDGGLTTVKKCVQQAMDYGMILEGDIADSTGGRKAKSKIRRTIITKTGGCSSECPPDLFGESGKIISCFLECTMIYCYYPDLRSLPNMRQGILK